MKNQKIKKQYLGRAGGLRFGAGLNQKIVNFLCSVYFGFRPIKSCSEPKIFKRVAKIVLKIQNLQVGLDCVFGLVQFLPDLLRPMHILACFYKYVNRAP